MKSYRFDEYIRGIFDPHIRVKYRFNRLKRLVAILNNYCNLGCYSCSSLCHLPFGNPFRDEPRTMSPDDLDKAIKGVLGYTHIDYVHLLGGEATLLDLKPYTEVVKGYDLMISLLTNGYGVLKVDLDEFDYIILDDHGVNHEDITRALNYFEENNFKSYYVRETLKHFDIGETLTRSGTSNGLKCRGWMKPTIYRDLIYPCCVMVELEGWIGDTVISDSLRRHGWTTDNPDLSDTLKKWRETIPAEVVKRCNLSCWRGRGALVWRDIKTGELRDGPDKMFA